MLAAIPWPILERIPLGGDLAISPHGIGIAVGFLVGAIVMVRRARKRGISRTYVADIDGAIQDLLVRAAVGAIVGARFFYVLTHFDQFADDPLAILRVWEGGLTFLGGLAGAIIVSLPLMRRYGYRPRMMLDSAAPGIAAGVVFGRMGDLMIGDHIGVPTDFPLAWECTSNLWVRASNSLGSVPPRPYPFGAAEAPTAGCFDVPVHQTALYDFGAALFVLLLILWLERKARFDGFFVAAFVYGYGALRFVSDFARQDRTWLALTGSQWAIVGAAVAVTGWLVVTRPWRRTPWAWDLAFDHPWLSPPPAGEAPSQEEPPAPPDDSPEEAEAAPGQNSAEEGSRVREERASRGSGSGA